MLRLIISGNSIESSSSGISSGSDGESSPVKPAEPKRRERLYHSQPVGASSTATPTNGANETAPAPVPSSSNVMSQIRRIFRPSTSSNNTVSFIMQTAWSFNYMLVHAFYYSPYSKVWFQILPLVCFFSFLIYSFHWFWTERTKIFGTYIYLDPNRTVLSQDSWPPTSFIEP